MFLYKEIKKEVAKKQDFFNDYLEDEGEEIGTIYLQYTFDMKKDRYRIILYPEKAKGKIIFYCSSLYMHIYYKSIAEQFKRYCIALEGAEETEEEYRRIWDDVMGMYPGPFLIKIDFKKGLMEEQNGNNISTILDEKRITIGEMSAGIDMDYAETDKLINRTTLNSIPLKTLIKIADFLNVEKQDLYK